MTRLVVLLVLAAAVGACGGGGSGERVVDVFAASSLTDAFARIEAGYETSHPGVDVRLNVAASSALREQVLGGAPADVFAAANESTMQELVDAGVVDGTPFVFAVNRLVLAVPTGNPAGVSGLADLARPKLFVGLCAVGVPCGDLARDVLGRAGVTASVDTDEPNVRSLTAKLADGELDAGLVYATDVAAVDGVVALPIPERFDVAARYPIALLAGGGADAADFVAYVRSPAGRDVLAGEGFELP